MRLRDISFQVCNFIPNLLYCNIYEILVITNVFILIIVQIKFTNNKKNFRFYVSHYQVFRLPSAFHS